MDRERLKGDIMPKVSIVIPVYNTEEYLEQCLNSVLEQTLTDIEVICVDDNSRDRSYQIMQAFAVRDPRVKNFHFDVSKSALQARKTGVLAAKGEYIMFLDADDYLAPHACEVLYEKIRKENVDILHFSSRVLNCANLPEGRIQHNEDLIRPYDGKLNGSRVFDACFKEKIYFIQLWNKIYKAELCKKAFADLEDRYLPKAQDFYSYFVIAHYAQSYMGWITEPLHFYCFGRGVTGSASLNLDKFERYCTQANIIDALKRFCNEKGITADCRSIIDKYYDQWITECIKLWKNDLPKELAAEGYQILCRYWGGRDTVACFARNYWFQRGEIARKLEALPQIRLKDRKIRTIAFYYYHMSIGGVQRVISLLVPVFQKMGYRVIIITDKEEQKNDYVFPESVTRVTVKDRDQVGKSDFELRLDSWAELIREYQIDVVLYNAWTSNTLIWDTLFLKNAGVPVIVHAHNVFSMNVNRLGKLFCEFPRTFSLVDGIVTLSAADKMFWDAFNPNVHHILNPVSTELRNTNTAKWESRSLIWVARVSDEKQPWMVFEIMAKVLQQVPDAKLYLLGNFDDPYWAKLAEDKGISEHVEFCGMIHNVNDYYEKASVHVVTSRYEGFLMTLLESMAHSLPTVAFEMPNLTLAKKERGVISVDMLDSTSAANEIVKLLKSKEHWEYYSSLARDSFEQMMQYDLESAWSDLLKGKETECVVSQDHKDMLYSLINHYEMGQKYLERQQKQQESRISNAGKNAHVDLEKSVSYKIGRAITYIPRKIRGCIWCCRDHGISYTIKLAFKKIVRIIHTNTVF